jgi:hypothetical protein
LIAACPEAVRASANAPLDALAYVSGCPDVHQFGLTAAKLVEPLIELLTRLPGSSWNFDGGPHGLVTVRR